MAMEAKLAYSQRSAARSSEFNGTFQQVYNVTGVGVSDDPTLAEGLPEFGDRIADQWICSSMRGQTHPELEGVAQVTVDYTIDPVMQPIIVNIFTSHKTMAAWKARGGKTAGGRTIEDGEQILNSAGDPYNPPLTWEKPLIRVEIVKRMANQDFDASWITDYAKHVNSTAFPIQYTDGNNHAINLGTYEKHTVFLSEIRAPELYEPYYHRQVTYCLEIDQDTWSKKVPDMGPRCWRADPNGKLRLVLPRSEDGAFYSGAALLDGTGKQLKPPARDDGTPESYNNQDSAFKENEFDVIGEAELRSLQMFDWGS